MNPGKLNTRIVIWQLTKVADSYGGFQEGSTEYITIWANYKQLKGDRSTENGQRATRTDVELISRTNTIDFINTNATSNWYFKVEGESDNYRINNIYESEYKNYTTINATKID
jgi:head-tail adaptor